MLAVIFGFSGALVFGCADFLGGLASRRINPYLVTAFAAVTGFIGVLIVSLLSGGVLSNEALLWGALSGLCGSIAIVMLYAALAIGPMSILSPLGALVSAAVPVSWAALTGQTLSPTGYVAIAIGLVAIVLVGFVPEKDAVRPSLRGVLLAIGSGVGIGLFMIFIDRAPSDAGLIPLVANRFVTMMVLFAIVGILAASRRLARPAQLPHPEDHGGLKTPTMRVALWMALATGIVDTTANALLIFGFQTGDLSVMSVLTAMYPAGTVILAATLLKERVAPWQAIGLVLAIAAAGLLALG